MTSRPALRVFPVIRRTLFAAALLCLAATLPEKPALAQGYEGLVETQSGYNAPRRGNQNTDGGGYDGLVGWTPQPSATNPYGTAPAGDIYQFVRGAGTTMNEKREQEKAAREEQKRARHQHIMDTNRQNAEAMQARVNAENEARQRKTLEEQAAIMQRIYQQQQQQQQQQRR